MQISLDYSMPFGNGIQTCENMEQTIARADKNQKNKGGGAARAALRMLEIENQMYPKIMANYEALTDAHNDDMTEMEAASWVQKLVNQTHK